MLHTQMIQYKIKITRPILLPNDNLNYRHKCIVECGGGWAWLELR